MFIPNQFGLAIKNGSTHCAPGVKSAVYNIALSWLQVNEEVDLSCSNLTFQFFPVLHDEVSS